VCLSGDDIEIMKISASLVFILCCVAIVAAQERIIDKTEFDALVASGNNHYFRWKDEKYRMSLFTSSKINGRPQTDWSSKMIHEHGAPNEIRLVSSSTFGGKPTSSQESIFFGKWNYSRVENGGWSRKEREAPSRGREETPESTNQLVKTDAEYKYLGKEILAGRPVDVYQKTERRTGVNSNNGENVDSDIKATYWFGGDGVMLKKEFRSENRSATLTMQTLMIIEWAIDPSIVVTEPVITPAKP